MKQRFLSKKVHTSFKTLNIYMYIGEKMLLL